MKKRLLILTLALITTLSFGGTIKVSAKTSTNSDQDYLQEGKFTGWNFSRELNAWQRYENGNIVKNNFINDKGKIYYAKDDGSLALGWINTNNNWYYFAGDNTIVTGWRYINNKWYFFDSNGIMQHDTKINGYALGSDGAWIQ